MKILALGDLHGKLPSDLDRIIKKDKVDVIVCVGEIPPVPITPKKGETREHAVEACNKEFENLVNKMCSYGLPLIVMRGNAYITTREGNEITRRIFSPHKNLYYEKTGLINVRGENFISFDMIWEEWSHKGISKTFLKRMITGNESRERKLNKLLDENKNSILLSHAPPFGYVDLVKNKRTDFKEKHVGSKILLDAIKRHKPKLVLCGHIHEAKGKANIGKTLVYNLGSSGDYAVIDSDNGKIIGSNFL